jgi:hypothetical protein
LLLSRRYSSAATKEGAKGVRKELSIQAAGGAAALGEADGASHGDVGAPGCAATGIGAPRPLVAWPAGPEWLAAGLSVRQARRACVDRPVRRLCW